MFILNYMTVTYFEIFFEAHFSQFTQLNIFIYESIQRFKETNTAK